MKTLILHGVHEVETEFGQRVVEENLVNSVKNPNLRYFEVKNNKGSNAMDKIAEARAYSTTLPVIQEFRPELIIDIHHGWGSNDNSYSVHFAHDPLKIRNSHEYGVWEKFLESVQANAGTWPRPEAFYCMDDFAWIGTETHLFSHVDEKAAEKLKGQGWYNFMNSGVQHDTVYDSAVRHTARAINSLIAFLTINQHLLR